MRWWFAAGLLLGALTLVKAVFQFLPLLLALLLIGATLSGPGRRAPRGRRVLWSAAMLVLAWALVVTPWLLRNGLHFGRPFVAERGGLQLITRAAFNELGARRHVAGLFYFTPNPSVNDWGYAVFKGRVMRGLEQHRGRSYFIASNVRYYQLLRNSGDPAGTDAQLTREGLGAILRNPLAHLSATLPLVWRGIFFNLSHVNRDTYDFYGARQPGKALDRHAPHWGWLGDVLLFVAFVWLCVRALRRRDVPLMLLLSPGAYLYLMDSLLTQNLPRFNQPMLPLVWIAGALAAQQAWQFAASSVRRARP